jgi:DDE family transposase
VADAGFNGYGLARAIMDQGLSFLIRMSAKVTLLVDQPLAARTCETLVWYWPEKDRQAGQPPLRLRLLRLRGKKKRHDVWLLTNVLEARRLPREMASQFYRWRWENEGLFRTYKRTLKKVKLLSRTVRLVHREAEGSLWALQLLLAHGTLAVSAPRRGTSVATFTPCSARVVLLAFRREIYGGGRVPRRARQVPTRERRVRRSRKEKRRWPRPNANHKPAKPPKLRELNRAEKRALAAANWLRNETMC